jgi:hypothetical protein
MDDALTSLRFALEKYPEKIEMVPVERLLVDSARQNEKRPAYIKLAVPDEMVKSVRGKREDRDVVLLVRIPNEVLDRADSRIVLPGEVG